MSDSWHVEPIIWPDERLKHAGPWHLGRQASEANANVQRQVEARGPVPIEVWGGDIRRQFVGRRICRSIKKNIGWRVDYFIPEDPFDLLCWGGWFDLAEVEVIIDIEEVFSMRASDEEWSAVFDKTFSEVVDFVIRRAPEHATAPCAALWPSRGAHALEAMRCPTGAVFRDLRGFLRDGLGLTVKEIRPSSRLARVVPQDRMGRLEAYIRDRFGVEKTDGEAAPAFPGSIFPFAALSIGIAMVLCVGSFFIGLPRLGAWAPLVAPLLSFIILNRVRSWVFVRRVHTVGDLAKWILVRRARIPCPIYW